MPIIDNEPDDRSIEAETSSVPTGGSWNRPLLLAGLGLALMLGGYAALNYVPPTPLTPRQEEQERQLAELRELAAKRHADGTAVDALDERLKPEPPWRTPPYQIPGRLAIYGGLFLFVAAGFLMYRKSPPKKDAEEPE
jgi:hypothetical protein